MVTSLFVYLVSLSLFHLYASISTCWQKGRSVTSVDREILDVKTMKHCESAVRLIAEQDDRVKSVAFERNGNAEEGFCKMSITENSNKVDSAYFALLKCLNPILGM